MPEPSGASVIIVRHGCAGDKQTWQGDDEQRPPDDGGTQQATALAQALTGASITRLLASATKRFTQTLEPLSDQRQMGIEPSELLGPGRSILDALFNDWPTLSGAIMCTHGETMLPLLAFVHDHDVPIAAERSDEEWLLTKGSAWHVSLDDNGHILELRHEAPLPLPNCESHASSD